MSRLMSTLTCASLTLAVISPIAAQEGPGTGFWIGAGVGGAAGSLTLEGLLDTKSIGPAGFVALGGTIPPLVRLGVEMSGWRAVSGDTTSSIGFFTAVAAFYPVRTLPLYIKAGFGASGFREDRLEQGSPVRYEGNAFGAEFGVGADFRLSSAFVLGGYAQWLTSKPDGKRNNLPLISGNVSANVVQVGVHVRYHRRN
jgi:hypothetical protein